MVDPAVALAAFAGLVLLAAAVAWPRRGVLARLSELARLTERVRLEDALKHIYTWESAGRVTTLESLAGRLEISTARAAELIKGLTELGLALPSEHGPALSEEGRASALRLVRTHRLWERYLADRTNIPAADWHAEAERMEHALSREEADALASRLGHPRWDPHGDPIPTAAGGLPEVAAMTLAGAAPGSTVEVVHLEDEPREIYDEILREGVALGARIEVLERADRGMKVRLHGREVTLDSVQARNVSVAVLPEGTSADEARETLADLAPGEEARVTGLSVACRGPQRRRLLDLGVVPGTVVRAEMSSATGDPVAYLIRGALVALRREQAEWVTVERPATEAAS